MPGDSEAAPVARARAAVAVALSYDSESCLRRLGVMVTGTFESSFQPELRSLAPAAAALAAAAGTCQ